MTPGKLQFLLDISPKKKKKKKERKKKRKKERKKEKKDGKKVLMRFFILTAMLSRLNCIDAPRFISPPKTLPGWEIGSVRFAVTGNDFFFSQR